MNIPVIEIGNVVILTLKGAILGGPEAGALNELLHRMIDNGKRNVVLDLSNVTFMNSTGLGMLIGGYTTMTNNGGTLKLAALNENTRNLIKITKLDTVFLSFTSVDEAVESFTS